MVEYKPNNIKKRLTLSEESDASNTYKPLRKLIQKVLENYFAHIDEDMPPREVYRLVMKETEIPLLETTLAYTKGNQCEAAEILGISRSTLRKKLQQHTLSSKE